MATVLVLSRGASGAPDFPGNTWVQLQWVLGLERLGVESYWVDYLGPVDPFRNPHSLEYLVDRFAHTVRDFGLEERFCVVYNGGERYFGLDRPELERLSRASDALLCISGQPPLDSPVGAVPRRAYVDVDPGFTQVWAHQWDLGFARFNFFFTTGQNVGRDDFPISANGIQWRPILPPVVLDLWPARIDERCRRFTTVADWRGSQEGELAGELYAGKRDEFLRVIDLPERTGARFELALCIGQHDHEDLGRLTDHGWRVRDPYEFAGDPHSYREFIQYSRGEFSVAKSGYVKSKSGWFSDRTACYLASGKPCIVQSTGFEWTLPADAGLLTFSTVDEAAERIREVEADYVTHCRAARRIAEEHFDSDRVLGRILEQVGL